MNIRNVEFKARISCIEEYESALLKKDSVFIGTDHQIDTYFNTSHGRLKLREGNIENALIHYEREDTATAKESRIILYKSSPDPALKEILSLHLGIRVVVDKIRKIHFIDNVKFHFDEVKGLGTFLEVEAIDGEDRFTPEELRKQCDIYFEFFGLVEKDLVNKSYSDLLLEKKIDRFDA